MSMIESKRVQYRKYLERAGVIDALSKALIKLYEEQNKPDDAIRFVRKFMCESCPDDAQFDAIKADLEEANRTISRLEQELERMKDQIKKTPEEIAELLQEGYKKLMEDEEHTGSLLRKYLTNEILEEYLKVTTAPPVEASLLDCVQSGFTHHNSMCGVYAVDYDSYDVFNKLFDPIIRDYHGQLDNEKEQLQPDVDYGNVDEIENLDPQKKYIISGRIRVCRNLEGYPFFAKLREKQFIEIENKVKMATESLDGELAGAYYSINDIPPEAQEELRKRSVLFKKGDEFLQSAGCYRFWPVGRGIFYNPAETFIIWVNEEDHLRIMSMAKCGDLGDIYNRLIKGLNQLEKNLTFMRHPHYGYVSACPTNLGTTIRCSVHMRLPHLARDEERLKTLANDLNLQIRGTGGEHTPVINGVLDVSYRKRLGLSEFEAVKYLQENLVTLIKAEEELEASL